MAVTQNTANYPASEAQKRHIIGDLVSRFYNLTGTGTADTFNVPFPAGDIFSIDCQPTTNVSIGATWAAQSGNPQASTVTFTASGAWTAIVQVISRVG